MRARRTGFTLIEVLAALVIVALGMLGVIEAVSQTARNGAYLRDKTLAHWVAMNVITERRLQNSPPDVGDSSDEVEMAGYRWRYTMKVTQTQVDTMRRMDVSVRPADSSGDNSLVTVTGFYGTVIGESPPAAFAWTGSDQGGQGGGDDDGTDGGGSQDDGTNNPNQPPTPSPPQDDTSDEDEE
jgi:general secretion pathway protein I